MDCVIKRSRFCGLPATKVSRARAWCSGADAARGTALCERPGVRDGWLASAGAELVVDLAVQYDVPYRLRIGAAAPYAGPVGVARRGAFYVTLGSLF